MSETLTRLDTNPAPDEAASNGRFFDVSKIAISPSIVDESRQLPEVLNRDRQAKTKLAELNPDPVRIGKAREKYIRGDRSLDNLYIITDRLDAIVYQCSEYGATVAEAGAHITQQICEQPTPFIANIGSRTYWIDLDDERRKVLCTTDEAAESVIAFTETLPSEDGSYSRFTRYAVPEDYALLITGIADAQAAAQP